MSPARPLEEHISDTAMAGLVVLDFTRLLPGPYAAYLLRGFGADVIKVEDTEAGDYARGLHPLPRSQTGAAFTAANAGKRSIALDLKQAQGREAALALARRADVLVESFRPGVMQRLGLGHEVLRCENPRLVYCSITGYGQHGPLAPLAGHDLNYQGCAGILPRDAATGHAVLPQTLTSDLVGGAYSATMSIMAALLARQVSGQGCYIDLSIAHATAMLLPIEGALVGQQQHPDAPGLGRLNGGHPCYGLYETADGRQVTFAALEEKFWRRFCERAPCPELAEIPDLTAPPTASRVRAALARIFRTRTQAEWVAFGAQWDVCLGPALTSEEALHALGERPAWRSFAGPGGPVRVLRGLPVAGDGVDLTPPPSQGQHSAQILRELGWDEPRIHAALASGAARQA
ncbi:hypothetical protein AD428_08430 [Achromobacter sp. DMS1]|uniref:CaiB/BaiF CoA transferase family protein n=1 Tax=Achromobacter sp. DMS1 TaxID=1688405 RepID=UPI00069F23BB|nr:CaiB/BaiF CoA-transferase family protein [Achromobacter sp. DMS1]KOF54215.1 hypothetical protein AD428_08430 [Achromobacter sp. DMS1]